MNADKLFMKAFSDEITKSSGVAKLTGQAIGAARAIGRKIKTGVTGQASKVKESIQRGHLKGLGSEAEGVAWEKAVKKNKKVQKQAEKALALRKQEDAVKLEAKNRQNTIAEEAKRERNKKLMIGAGVLGGAGLLGGGAYLLAKKKKEQPGYPQY